MRQTFLLSLLIVTLAACTGKKEQLCTSIWQGEAISIDGHSSDWGETLRFADTAAKLRYDIRNDDHNLYLVVETDDNTMRLKLMHTWLKITLNRGSGPATAASITMPPYRGDPFVHRGIDRHDAAFREDRVSAAGPGNVKCEKPCGAASDSVCPKPCSNLKVKKDSEQGRISPDAVRRKGNRPGAGVRDTVAPVRKPVPVRVPAIAEGFYYINGNVPGFHSKSGRIAYTADMSDLGTLTYEVIIPLRELYGHGYDLAAIAKDIIRLELAAGALEKTSLPGLMPGEKPENIAGPANPAGELTDSPAGPRGEGMPGGTAHLSAPPDTAFLFQSQSIRCNVRLAAGK